MRTPPVTLAWLWGFALWVVGCASPVTEAVPTTDESTPRPLAVQAVAHALVPVRPVLVWRENPAPNVPMALTASDGTGLDLVSLRARVVIEDPLAFTELRLVFDNPEDRVREGRFEIELPPGAALSRLAMRIGQTLQEGEVVERAKARRTYESFMHQRPNVDPALLENDTANRVQARVFPIAARERKEIIVSFSQELGGAPYRLPLQGLSTVEDFDAQIVVKTHDGAQDRSSLDGARSAQRVVEFQRTHFAPDKDLVVELDGAGAAAGLHAGTLAVVRVRPQSARPAATPRSLLVLFDTSASTVRGFEDRVERFGHAMAQLAALQDIPVRVLGFDQQVRPLFEGAASELDIDALADIIEGRALGASNLGAALETAAAGKGRWQRALLVSDGVATAGVTDRAQLRAAARKLETLGVRRMDVLAPADRRDRAQLLDLTTALPAAGVIVDDTATPDAIVQSLRRAPFGDVRIAVDGADWSWPRSLEGVQPGEDVLVYAQYPRVRPPSVRVEFSDPSIAPQLVSTLRVEEPLVERAWVNARIDRIEHELARTSTSHTEVRERLSSRIVELSTHYRVLSDLTAMLVLETEADYRRYGIDRRGRADILTADGGSVRVHRRASTRAPALDVADDLWTPYPTPSDDEAGSRGTRHRGEEGRMGSPSAKPPHRVASGAAGYFDADGYALTPEDNAGDDADVWAGLVGSEVGEAFGVGGLGLVGTGRGGGGSGEGTIGLGSTGVIGHGGGGGTGHGYGAGAMAGHAMRSVPTPREAVGLGSVGMVGGPWGSRSPLGTGVVPLRPPSTGGRGRPTPRVHQLRPTVLGRLDPMIVRRVARAHSNELRFCYNRTLAANPHEAGRVEISFSIEPSGRVSSSIVKESTVGDKSMASCMAQAVGRWRFPTPSEGMVHVVLPVRLGPGSKTAVAASRSPRRARRVPRKRTRPVTAPHTGRFAEAQRLLADGQVDDAYALATRWVKTQPGDTLGLLAMGRALEHRGRPQLAARVYGSLIDLHPSRADIRRAAGERLEALGDEALALAVDTYQKAAASRPDQPSGMRLHAWALVRQQRYAEAFEVLRVAATRHYPFGRFAGVRDVLRDDLAIVGALWFSQDPSAASPVLVSASVGFSRSPTTRFVLSWETDTTDLDLLLHAPGSQRRLGSRTGDVTTGFGPEALVFAGDRIPDRLDATVRYYERRAMGHAMGSVQVIKHDGQGGITIDSHPFVLMQQGGALSLGRFDANPVRPTEAS